MARQRRMRGYQMAAKLFLTWKEFAGYAREFGHAFTSAQNSLPQDEALALIEKVQHVRELLQQQPKQIFEQTSTTGSYELLRGYPISWDVEAVNVDTPGQTMWQKSTKICSRNCSQAYSRNVFTNGIVSCFCRVLVHKIIVLL